ncbi:hypothetical protein GF323_00330 [Candidatus Woesearchaeota archaeon]|nr:hypothetical protein [Candidatus Woesearchaeota archaeon]
MRKYFAILVCLFVMLAAANAAPPARHHLISEVYIPAADKVLSQILTVDTSDNFNLAAGLKVGPTATAIPGMIRFANNKFEGYNGTAWIGFGAGGSGSGSGSGSPQIYERACNWASNDLWGGNPITGSCVPPACYGTDIDLGISSEVSGIGSHFGFEQAVGNDIRKCLRVEPGSIYKLSCTWHDINSPLPVCAPPACNAGDTDLGTNTRYIDMESESGHQGYVGVIERDCATTSGGSSGVTCQVLHPFNSAEAATQGDYEVDIPSYCIDSSCTIIFNRFYSDHSLNDGKAMQFYQDSTLNTWVAGEASNGGVNGDGTQDTIVTLGGTDIYLFDDRGAQNDPAKWTMTDNHGTLAGELIVCGGGGSGRTGLTYDSGWFPVNAGEYHTLAPNQGTYYETIEVLFSPDANYSRRTYNNHVYYGGGVGWIGPEITQVDSNTLKILTASYAVGRTINSDDTVTNWPSGYYRVIAWK